MPECVLGLGAVAADAWITSTASGQDECERSGLEAFVRFISIKLSPFHKLYRRQGTATVLPVAKCYENYVGADS